MKYFLKCYICTHISVTIKLKFSALAVTDVTRLTEYIGAQWLMETDTYPSDFREDPSMQVSVWY